MSDNRVIIRMKNTSVFSNGKPILDEVSYDFRKQVVTGIIGPSGTGKTTLLRTLSRLNDRIDGFRVLGQVLVGGTDIYLNGLDVYGLRRRVGMVFQKPCVFPSSIFDNVILGLKRLSPKRKKEFPDVVEKTLRKVFLWDEVKDRLHKSAPTLSQGQQQRLAIARTLAVDPEILLMDEPTSALDPKSVTAIEDLILSLKGRHTVVLVTHNLPQARRVADDLIFLKDGKIIEAGACETLFQNPARDETREYLAAYREQADC